MPESSNPAPEVLIVGAGPVGMTAALALTQAGIKTRIIDRKPGPVQESRAAAVHVRTLEILDGLGIADRWMKHGNPLHGATLFVNRKPIGLARLDDIPGLYPGPLVIGQDVTERLLEAALAEQGVAVEYETEAVDFAQHGTVATVTLKTAQGEATPVEAGWVIACEGAHSKLREAAGIGFEAIRNEGIVVPGADAVLRWSFPPGRAYLFLHEARTLAILPFDDHGFCRILVAEPDRNPDDHSPPELSEIEAHIREIADSTAQLSDARWRLRYRSQQAQATAYRKGRLLLAGDSAHVHSAVGGQGMNTGIQDAANLAWKLAAVLHGAPETLLDTYHAERAPVAAAVLRGTRLGQAALSHSPVMSGLIRMLGPVALRSDRIRTHIRDTLEELTIAYPDSPLSEGHDGGHPRAGERAPDAVVVRLDGLEAARLLDLRRHPGWTLFAFAGSTGDPAAIDAALDAVSAAGERLDGACRGFVLCTDPDRWNDRGNRAARVLVDRIGEAHEAYHASGGAIVLIRPDGYVGFRGRIADAGKIGPYLDRVLGVAARK
jgi:2-polyprenyl-6-methoxyphenol hydroxylase-like FAD-dependent oxidoreductase